MIEALQKAFESAPGGIENIDQLRCHFQVAIQLEHATIPPYLCALYSIRDGHNVEAARVIRSVVMEEMLHITLVANVLNAIGEKPDIVGSVATYPTTLPHSSGAFTVSLRKFSPAAIDTFLNIERPAKRGAKAQADGYHSIGQFYAALEKGLRRVCRNDRYFDKKDLRGSSQVFPRQYYGSIGSAFPVTDLASALRALKEIVDQGEGFDHTLFASRRKSRLATNGRALAHYFRFEQIALGRLYQNGDKLGHPTGPALDVDWEAVYDMADNPKAERFEPGSDIREKMDGFNRTYMGLLESLEQSLGGDPTNLMASVGAMYDLKYKAVELMKVPMPDGSGAVGPSFERVERSGRAAA